MKTRADEIREAAKDGCTWADSHPAPLTIPDEEIEKDALWCGIIEHSHFKRGVRWALEYLNAQRGVKP